MKSSGEPKRGKFRTDWFSRRVANWVKEHARRREEFWIVSTIAERPGRGSLRRPETAWNFGHWLNDVRFPASESFTAWRHALVRLLRLRFLPRFRDDGAGARTASPPYRLPSTPWMRVREWLEWNRLHRRWFRRWYHRWYHRRLDESELGAAESRKMTSTSLLPLCRLANTEQQLTKSDFEEMWASWVCFFPKSNGHRLKCSTTQVFHAGIPAPFCRRACIIYTTLVAHPSFVLYECGIQTPPDARNQQTPEALPEGNTLCRRLTTDLKNPPDRDCSVSPKKRNIRHARAGGKKTPTWTCGGVSKIRYCEEFFDVGNEFVFIPSPRRLAGC